MKQVVNILVPRQKIGKLLSILAFKYAVNDEQLFKEQIYKYDNCGTYIRETAFLVYRDEYHRDSYQNDKKYINDQLQKPTILNLTEYSRYEYLFKNACINFRIKEHVKDVFRNFGSYSQKDLSDVLNPIVEKLTDVSYGPIELSKVSSVIDEVDQDNEVVKYLKSHKKDNNVEKNKMMIKKY